MNCAVSASGSPFLVIFLRSAVGLLQRRHGETGHWGLCENGHLCFLIGAKSQKGSREIREKL